MTRLAEVERVLHKNSSNSSKPPSSDPPHLKKHKKKPSGKKQGGQPGHKGRARSLVPPERVNVVVAHPIVGPCGQCGTVDVKQVSVGERHQVFELPDIRPEVTEHQLMKGRCVGCSCRRHFALAESKSRTRRDRQRTQVRHLFDVTVHPIDRMTDPPPASDVI